MAVVGRALTCGLDARAGRMVPVRESVGGLPPLLRLNLPRSLYMMCARALRALEGRSSHAWMHVVHCWPQAVGPVI